ncbi:MAG: hypothetical protein ABFD03_05905 [Clostridiaceae bacterium]
MEQFTNDELSEAQRAIESSLHKSEKVLQKLREGTFSHSFTARGIAAYDLALELIQTELHKNGSIVANVQNRTVQELDDAIRFFEYARNRVEKVLPKFQEGTPQHTLAVRRIRAFEIAETLIKSERREKPNAVD